MSENRLEYEELSREWAVALDGTFDSVRDMLCTESGSIRADIDAPKVRAALLLISVTEKKAMLHMARQARDNTEAAAEKLRRDLGKERKERRRLEKLLAEKQQEIDTLKPHLLTHVPVGKGHAYG